MMGKDFERYFKRRWREERPSHWAPIHAIVAVGVAVFAAQMAFEIFGLAPTLAQIALELSAAVWVRRRQERAFDRRGVAQAIADEWLNGKREMARWN